MTDLQRLGRLYRSRRAAVDRLLPELHAAVRAARDDGVSESEIARQSGLTRVTVRRVLKEQA